MEKNNIQEVEALINFIEKKHELDRDGLVSLLLFDDPVPIYNAADRVRKNHVGDEVHLRGLIEFSNYCCRTCFYCGLRAANNKIKRFRMQSEEIIECAKYAASHGIKTIVLQSGEDKAFTINELCNLVYNIKKLDVAITLSIGELSKDEYTALKNAGADRYLLRIETSNEKLYESIHPNMSYKNRVRCLYDLKELGFEVGTGSLIGLPGQTFEMLADDLLFFKKIEADMIGMGPFIPCENTPLQWEKGGKAEIVLKMMALARLLMPDINMPVTTALRTRDVDAYKKGLSCGANVIMPNVGLDEYRKLYTIYPGKGNWIINAENQIETIKSIVFQLGRSISRDYGYRKRK